MKSLALSALLIALAVSLAGCNADGGDDVATDPAGGGGTAGPAAPTSIPAAPGRVRTRWLATVMDVDSSDDLVELCLGAVAESYPPQCGGPAITNWDWDATYARGMFDEQGSVRWATFAVTGTWDVEAFTVSDAIPGALYDPMVEPPPNYPEPAVEHTAAELEKISNGLRDLPGYQGSAPVDGRVLLDLTYDDGSIQQYLDETYGENVVIAAGALVDLEI